MDLSRQDYPGMLVSLTLLPTRPVFILRDHEQAANANQIIPQTHLQPAQAVKVLDDRVKYINRINVDIADWLQVGSITAGTSTTKTLTCYSGTAAHRRGLCPGPTKAGCSPIL